MLERQTIRYIATARKRGRALVAMVRVSGVLLGIGMLMLAGCSPGTGPPLANALDVNLEVILRYADGEIRNLLFKPGMVVNVGKSDRDKDPVEVIPIQELVIKEAGQLLYQFNAEAVRLLIEKQDSDRGWWCIDREKVYLSLPPNSYPDAREECSKGNRLWTWQNGRFYKGGGQSP